VTVVSSWKMDLDEARDLLENQKRMTPHQRLFARDCPHLLYVVPIRRPISRSRKLAIYERDGGKCAYCATPLGEREFTVDHRLPVARDGTDDPDNLACCCAACNRAKWTRTDEEFVAR
jgi:5-methylcytosine-specific restriction endonuclease McrA